MDFFVTNYVAPVNSPYVKGLCIELVSKKCYNVIGKMCCEANC